MTTDSSTDNLRSITITVSTGDYKELLHQVGNDHESVSVLAATLLSLALAPYHEAFREEQRQLLQNVEIAGRLDLTSAQVQAVRLALA